MNSEREEFSVDPEKYYREIHSEEAGEPRPRPGTHEHMAEAAMRNVVARYDLANRNILSLASGEGFEEYWMLRAGARVTCVDDFSDHRGRPRVEKASASPESSKFRYIKSDFFEFVAAGSKELYDACYISSFPPDELAREPIQAAYRAKIGRFSKILGRLSRSRIYKTWPDDTPPFIQAMMDTRKLIKTGGLLLIQSYRGGVDIIENPHYPDLIARQMLQNDLALLEIHFFRRAPGVVLIAAAAGVESWQDWRARLDAAVPINEFHGRYPHEDIRRDVGVLRAPGPDRSSSRKPLSRRI